MEVIPSLPECDRRMIISLCHEFSFPSGSRLFRVSTKLRGSSRLGEALTRVLHDFQATDARSGTRNVLELEAQTMNGLCSPVVINVEVLACWLLGSYIWYLLNLERTRSQSFYLRYTGWLVQELVENAHSLRVGYVSVTQFSSRCILSLEKSNSMASGKKDVILHTVLNFLPLKINMEPDKKWSSRLFPYYVKRLLLEYIMACLSTLGGAHSSLGEQSLYHAEIAGQISIKQMKVALKLQDSMLVSRCKLFLAQSYMQRGQYRSARKIVKKQYKLALSSEGKLDTKLLACCQAAWIRLNYLEGRNWGKISHSHTDDS